MTFCSLVMISVLSNAEAGRCAPRPLRARPRLTLQPNDTVCPIDYCTAPEFGKIPIRCGSVGPPLRTMINPRSRKPSPDRLSLVHALFLTASKRVPNTKVSLPPACKFDISGSGGVSIQ
jgi:hypothetical protein